MERAVPTEWEEALNALVEQVRVGTGLDLEASLRWVSPEEQRAWDDDFERLQDVGDAQMIRLGLANPGHPSRSLRTYEGYWALVLPGQESSIYDRDDFSAVIEDYVIEEVWRRTGSAPNPGFLRPA